MNAAALVLVGRRPLSASGLERALACIGSQVLPQTSQANRYSSGGTRMHKFIERARAAGKDKAIDEALRDVEEDKQGAERDFLMGLDLDAIPAGCEHEVGFAYNVRTGAARRIAGREDGYPEAGPDEILGTVDLVGLDSPTVVFVGDLKRYIFRSSADQCAQTDFYALCAVRVAGAEEARTILMRPIRSGWATDRARLDEMRLDAFADSLTALVDRRAQAAEAYQAGGAQALLERGMLAGGPQCELCDARLHCPMERARLESFAVLDVSVLAGALPIKISEENAVAVFKSQALASMESMTVEEVGRAYIAARLVLLAATGAKEAADEIAARTPLPLPNGMQRYEGTTTRPVPSEIAKAEITALKEELKARGEIKPMKVPQMRTGRARS